MQWSSTGRLLGFWPLVIQPSSVLPSKRSSQPSDFSRGVNSLSAATAGTASTIAADLADVHPAVRVDPSRVLAVRPGDRQQQWRELVIQEIRGDAAVVRPVFAEPEKVLRVPVDLRGQPPLVAEPHVPVDAVVAGL